MKQLIFEYQMKLSFSDYVREQQFQLKCLPQNNLYQRVIDSQYTIYPLDTVSSFTDGFGNSTIAGSAITRHKEFRFNVKGIVEVDYSCCRQEECHPIYRYETELTRYCPEMESLSSNAITFLEQMKEVMHKVHRFMQYQKNVTTIHTTACEAFGLRAGVCQDFAHIMIAVCRHLGYPARYVAGMLYGEGETHAWVEVFFHHTWYGFDPANDRIVNDNYIVLAKGRDYQDCVIDKGIFLGNCTQKLDVSVSVKS